MEEDAKQISDEVIKSEVADEAGNILWSYSCKHCGSVLLSIPQATIDFVRRYEKEVRVKREAGELHGTVRQA